ncbi:alpha/beta hydrolase [Staphylococcus schweitzeri]|uniref:Alpha/beta hydrolase n=1 Tax=Staphylococcus schweitzeri TaxID=1654388 RepID=A0A2K4ADV0_9STAP|nr:alpha/beta hydrolase [Staphylococcus schweitzeri]MBE2128509.1 alpha/beta hydrolase [Staphylococcus schweitzeri]PNZ48273.1 alpha/beta hydrolase [Staphylococcus schweitzeri]CDR26578.1 putative hydrolase [Staphylococcus schweitzeri]CDR51737.1 putative hydrolase [Staphylococcus schweitzeri]CDR53639.1 putative hydrolase [Staphylococcus schweitzeri]
MAEKQFKLTVQDNTNIEVKVNFTDVESKGIVHIFHGMAEHMERYDKLASAISAYGFDVIRHNHRGHGINIDESTRGHYDDMKQVISDAIEVAQTVRGNVDKPYIIIGHSMGSIIARFFVETYPKYVDGLVLSGTGMYPLWKGLPTVKTLKIITKIYGAEKRVEWVNKLVSSTFNKKIRPLRTKSDWISSNPVEVDKFVKDPYSGFNVSNQLLYETAYYMLHTSQLKHMKVLKKSMPILFVSGYNDPLGDYGKGILKLANIYRKAGLKNVKVNLYHNKRHEILFEKDYENIWEDLFKWLNQFKNK